MYLHVTRYDYYYYLQHMQAFLKVALSKLYAHFKETLCCVPAENYSDGLKKMLTFKLRVGFLQLCLEYR